jgi:hypothetical protein
MRFHSSQSYSTQMRGAGMRLAWRASGRPLRQHFGVQQKPEAPADAVLVADASQRS